MRIAVVGAGAIGSIVAARLSARGVDVTAMDKNKAHIEKVNSEGLLVDGVLGEKRYRFKMVDHLEGEFDIIFLAVKLPVTEKACQGIKSNLAYNGVLVSLQNGMSDDIIKSIIGAHKIHSKYIAGVVCFGATNTGPGHITITSEEAGFIIGNLDGTTQDVSTQFVKAFLDFVAPTMISKNILGEQWSKLALNCIINPFCAITGKTFGENVNTPEIRRQMQEVLVEVIIAGHRSGITFSEIGGKYDICRIFMIDDIKESLLGCKISFIGRIKGFFQRIRTYFILRIIAMKHGKIMSSMWQDLQNKNMTEIEFLNGYVFRKAQSAGFFADTNFRITEAIHRLERNMK